MENDAWKGWLRSEMRWVQLAFVGARKSTGRGFVGRRRPVVACGCCCCCLLEVMSCELPTNNYHRPMFPLENLSAYSIPALSLSIHYYSDLHHLLPSWCWWHPAPEDSDLFFFFCKWVDYDHFEWSTRQMQIQKDFFCLYCITDEPWSSGHLILKEPSFVCTNAWS